MKTLISNKRPGGYWRGALIRENTVYIYIISKISNLRNFFLPQLKSSSCGYLENFIKIELGSKDKALIKLGVIITAHLYTE